MTSSPSSKTLVSSVFLKYKKQISKYQLHLTNEHLELKSGEEKKLIPWKNFIGSQCVRAQERPSCTGVYLILYSYQVREDSKKTRTLEHPFYNVYRDICTLSFKEKDTFQENFLMAKELQSILLQYTHSYREISPELPNKQGFLVMINPKSGSGKAYDIFKTGVNRVFGEASIGYQLFLTEYSGHARKLMRSLDYDQYEGIVIVSGDGLIHEVFNGLADRPDWKRSLKQCPIGVIAGGSGNAMAGAMAYRAGFTWKDQNELCLLNALMLVEPAPVPMDLVRIEYFTSPEDWRAKKSKSSRNPTVNNSPGQQQQPLTTEQRVSFLSVSWGLIANIDIDSEPLRFLGGMRFTVAALAKIMSLSHYEATVYYFPSESQEETHSHLQRSVDLESSVQLFPELNNPEDGTSTPIRRRIMSAPPDNIAVTLTHQDASPSSIGNDFIGGGDLQDETDAELAFESPKSILKLNENMKECLPKEKSDVDFASQPYRYLSPLNEPLPQSEKWVKETSEFVTVFMCYQSHLAQDTFISDKISFDDGDIHLYLVRRGISRKNLLNCLINLEAEGNQGNPFIKYVRCKAFRIMPTELASQSTYLSIDGEALPSGPLQGEIMPQAASLLYGKISVYNSPK